MKRAKVTTQPTTIPGFYQHGPFEQAGNERQAEMESASDVSEIRMLENLQMALFFSRAQIEMAKQRGL